MQRTIHDLHLLVNSMHRCVNAASDLLETDLDSILIINVAKVIQKWYVGILPLECLCLFELEPLVDYFVDLFLMFSLLSLLLQFFVSFVCLFL